MSCDRVVRQWHGLMDCRDRRRVEVRSSATGPASRIGFSGNISNTGMMNRTPYVMPPDSIVWLGLRLRLTEREITLSGRVVWARSVPMTLTATGRVGMGTGFIDPAADLIATLRSEMPAGAG